MILLKKNISNLNQLISGTKILLNEQHSKVAYFKLPLYFIFQNNFTPVTTNQLKYILMCQFILIANR